MFNIFKSIAEKKFLADCQELMREIKVLELRHGVEIKPIITKDGPDIEFLKLAKKK